MSKDGSDNRSQKDNGIKLSSFDPSKKATAVKLFGNNYLAFNPNSKIGAAFDSLLRGNKGKNNTNGSNSNNNSNAPSMPNGRSNGNSLAQGGKELAKTAGKKALDAAKYYPDPVVATTARGIDFIRKVGNSVANAAQKAQQDIPDGLRKNEENRKNHQNANSKSNENSNSSDNPKSDDKASTGEVTGEEEHKDGFIKGTVKKVIKFVVMFFIAIAVVVFLIFSGNLVSAHVANFAASTIRGEELIENDMEIGEDNSTSPEEKRFFGDLNSVYSEQNKQFNPDLVSSVFSVMMANSQYGRYGHFDYSDISKDMISKLASKLKGSQVESGNGVINNNTSAVTVEGVAAVASDAATAVGNVSGGFGRNEPANLVDTGRKSLDDNGCKLTADAWAAFQAMEQAAAADGVTIGVNSCYRSYDEQAVTTGNSPASAGYSEHQMGSTIDIANHDSGLIDNPTVNNWLYAHAAEYGFINRYFNMPDETHHFRFVGSAVAAAYGKYNTSAPGARPYYSMSYEEFVNSDEGKSTIGNSSTSSTSSSSNKKSTSSSKSSSSSGSSSSGGSADAIISIAEKEVGTGEQNNTTKYGIWYGLPDGEWCAMFVSWCANQAGVAEDVIPKYALVSDGRNFFKSRGLYHPVSDSSYTPKKGDVIFYSHGHTGLVKDYQNGMVTTIEGNTSSYTNPVVAEKTFNPLAIDIDGYGDVQYTNKSSTTSSGNTTTGNINNDEDYRDVIKEFILETFTSITDKIADDLVTEAFDFKRDYYDLINKKMVDCGVTSTSSSVGSCTYDIKGFVLEGTTEKAENLSVNDLKVRLMQCSDGTYGQPVPGEELVEFEKYILGVTYAEVGTDFEKEGAKSEAIAARSYALARPSVMHSSMGTGLVQEDGQWILQLRSCTDDQVYCDPDRGCSMESSAPSRTHYSGTDHPYVYKTPLPVDDPLRSYVAETNGQVLVNSKDYIINADYLDVDQQAWNRQALAGNDVTQILISHYADKGAANIKSMPCNGQSTNSSNPSCKGLGNSAGTASNGDYVNWKQHDERWASVSLGDSDMGHIGCTITAIAMMVAKSGVPTGNIQDFNPGTFAEALKAAGVTYSDGNTEIGSVSKVIPGFQYVGSVEFDKYERREDGKLELIKAPDEEKIAKAKELLDQGYYIIVKGNAKNSGSGHWVAIDRVENNRIYMLDPYHENGDLLNEYNIQFEFHWYKAVK